MTFASSISRYETPSASGPFTPSIIVPAQFFTRRVESSSPEKRLMIAVLEDAFNCYCKTGKSRRVQELRAEAEAWVASDDKRCLFAFEVICETLDLNADAIREALKRGRSNQHEGLRELFKARGSHKRSSTRRQGKIHPTDRHGKGQPMSKWSSRWAE